MSRSRRKSPFVGWTTAESDRLWKAQSARVVRRRVHQLLDCTGDGDALPGKRWSLVNSWSAPKDGKQRLRDPASPLLRK